MTRSDLTLYNDWREHPVTKRLFRFYKLEAELIRASMADLNISNGVSFETVGTEWYKLAIRSNVYIELDSIEYGDLYPTTKEDHI